MRSELCTQVGRRMQVTREAQGLSRLQLTERLEWGENTLRGYETGANKMPLDRFVEVANHLRVKPSILLGEHDSTIDEIYSLRHALDKALAALGRK